jgi:hypothetical protein
MEDGDHQQLALPAAGALAHAQHTHVKLPDFWTEDRVSWFKLVEGQFSLQNMVDPAAQLLPHALLSVPGHLLAHLARAPQGNWARLL